jgi:uncharacterized C2H2 Zn-finger protein
MSDFVVDLTKISGSGLFPCPKCGAILDPGAFAQEANYEILDSSASAEEILLKCKRCGSKIKIIGLGDAVPDAIERAKE